MAVYEQQFSAENNFPEVASARKVLVMATTPRCGSHMFGHHLYNYKQFGFPLEYLQDANLAKWQEIYGTTTWQDTLAALEKNRTSENGVFAIKIHYSHLNNVGGLKSFLSAYPNTQFILLRRRNVLKQAVSLAVAQQTGQWISHMAIDNPDDLHFDFSQIDRNMKRVIKETAAWQYELAALGVEFLELTFEDIVTDLHRAACNVAEFIGVETPRVAPEIEKMTAQQSSSVNKEWGEQCLQAYQESQHPFQLWHRRPSKVRALLNRFGI